VSALLLLLVAGTLVAVRLPSLVQPMGADQALYAYIGDRILQGERPYIDAWDQKPPAIHYTYALLRGVWPGDAMVAAADLVVAALVAGLLFPIGRELASRRVGAAAALLFLFLSNPAFGRLAGVRVRAQCETFIALAVAGAAYLLIRHGRGGPWIYGAAGLLLGAAFTFKYNAAIYAAAAAAGLVFSGALTARRAVAFVVGCAALPLACLILFGDSLAAFYDATILYNVRYSGETYHGPLDFFRYLLTFPVAHARVDALWTLGGAGCAVLLGGALHDPRRLVPVAWVAAACLSVAINSSRGLPQYFVQAAPALALAAAWAAWMLATAAHAQWARPRARAALAVALLAAVVATWRVNQFPKLVEQTWFDAQYMAGRMERDEYLARYVDGQKYTALGAAQVARLMRAHSEQADTVYLFGFTAASYVHAGRQSASRFFWSRPVIAGFNEGVPGYGVAGLLDDLDRARPAVVALQVHDWAPDVDDSAHFFMSTPALAGWLRAAYHPLPGPEGFDVWVRRD
jgi:4-amino-4-deoxy-L-arabinose transferase-like glycosyltransferase